jgi:DNA-binding FrmR family transcriptional regulator
LHAVQSAIASAKRTLIHDHMEHCLNGSATDAKAALKELKELTKYL